MNWQNKLTLREKLLCLLSLIAIITGVWIHIGDSIEQDKQFYTLKLNNEMNFSLAKDKNINIITSQQNSTRLAPHSAGELLDIINISLSDFPTINLLSIDILNNQSGVIKLMSNLKDITLYLEALNKNYPFLSWKFVRYRLVNDGAVIEFSYQLAKTRGGS